MPNPERMVKGWAGLPAAMHVAFRAVVLAGLLLLALASAGCNGNSSVDQVRTETKVVTSTTTTTATTTVTADAHEPQVPAPTCDATVASDEKTLWTYAYNETWSAPSGGAMGFRQASVPVAPRNVWLPIDKAQWIWNQESPGDDPTTVLPVMFERTFIACQQAPAGSATLAVTADNTYIVFVNGRFVGVCGSGTYQASATSIEDESGCYTTVHTYQLPPLEAGVNQVVAYVWNQNSRGHFQFQLDY